jgi:hypothetical protein
MVPGTGNAVDVAGVGKKVRSDEVLECWGTIFWVVEFFKSITPILTVYIEAYDKQ